MGNTISIGVIGAGRIGRLHAENLVYRVPEARVLAVSDVRREAAESCAAALGIPAAHEDPRAVLEDKRIDAVLICSSTDTHSPLIEAAAAAGKHIFCEKPVDFDLGRIDAALAGVKKAGVKLQIGFNRRFDHNFRRVRDAVAEGKIGKLYSLRITSRDPAPPPIDYVKVSGGMFLDMTIHDFDMARFLTGSEVDEVYTLAGVMVDPEIGRAGDVDTALVTLKFKNGVIGCIENCRKAVYGYDQRVEILGSDGMIATENDRPNTARLATAKAVTEDLPLHFFLERYTESYVAEMKSFVECVAKDREPPVTGLDGRMPVVMGKAARLSYELKRPVKLEEIG
jgi:myo-inositol 2-dehydrogenase/D-chiro-inositol 1-dehydrogenase